MTAKIVSILTVRALYQYAIRKVPVLQCARVRRNKYIDDEQARIPLTNLNTIPHLRSVSRTSQTTDEQKREV